MHLSSGRKDIEYNQSGPQRLVFDHADLDGAPRVIITVADHCGGALQQQGRRVNDGQARSVGRVADELVHEGVDSEH